MSDRTGPTEVPGAITAPEDDPRIAPTVVVGAIGVALTLVIIVGLEALYHRTLQADVERSFAAAPPPAHQRLATEQLERLNGYRWVDRENGVVSIPIERAMDLVVAESDAAAPRDGAAR